MPSSDGVIYINPTFAINDYNQPKYMSDMESKVTDILMILLGKPGFYPSIPSLGMDIQQYLYMFEDEISTEAIKAELVRQCNEFEDDIDTGDLDVVATTWKDHLMLIFVLPIINDVKKTAVALGITTNTNGELVYKFTETTEQTQTI